ncbi:hypothetical protein [Methanosarcina siciliae]|uniref:hypothetical protein n=1 Tax=Methanosarcina siciliae TaxID=38027 RepID=UPI000B26663F|nr:hypothetical protein [Methanosarcina siciliae]
MKICEILSNLVNYPVITSKSLEIEVLSSPIKNFEKYVPKNRLPIELKLIIEIRLAIL